MQSPLNEDRRKNASMEDSTAMTVEFLRARLLSERSVSRTVRQRADELAKRVIELEEQLKIVSLQRKKAEKATADVLAILENHGISDVSEAFDSSSDQEVAPCESNVSNNSTKEEEKSINSKVRGNDAEEYSGSEFDSSPITGRSLSWKSSKGSPHSHKKKYLDSSLRKRSSYASTGYSSPKQRLGKSCRQIRHRETRSAVEELKVESVILDAQENGAATHSEGFLDCSKVGPGILKEGSDNQEEKVLPEGLCLEDQRKETSLGLYLDGHGEDKDMERALEHQAQLIGRYAAEEKAQREWEEKFRENNNSTPDSCEPGNHSDITEERDECKTQASYLAGTAASLNNETNSKAVDVHFTNESSKTHPNGFQPPLHDDTECLQDHKGSRMLGNDPPASEFAFPTAKEKQNQEHIENYSSHSPSRSSHHYLCPPHLLEKQPANVASSSHADSSVCKAEASGSPNKLALMSNETPDGLGGVLGALQQARLTLKQKLHRLPLIEGGPVEKAIKPSFPAMRAADRPEIPVGCAQLFRVPTDFQFEATTRANFVGSRSRFSLTNYYADTGNALTAGDQYAASPYMETRSSAASDGRLMASPYTDGGSRISSHKPYFDPYSNRGGDRFVPSAYMEPRLSVSASDQFFTSPYADIGSRLSAQKSAFDPYLDSGLPSSSRYTYPIYPDPMPRMPSNEGFSRPLLSRAAELPPAERFSLYDDHIRPNMYR